MARLPSTPALRQLRAAGVAFEPHTYTYVARGGTAASAAALGVDEHRVIKTLVFEDGDGSPMIVLMHGDLQVSTKALARHLGTREVRPCAPAVAQKHTGYQVGGTSPFGTRKELPVYVESSILDLETIYINGGARGALVCIAPSVLVTLLDPQTVQVGRRG